MAFELRRTQVNAAGMQFKTRRCVELSDPLVLDGTAMSWPQSVSSGNSVRAGHYVAWTRSADGGFRCCNDAAVSSAPQVLSDTLRSDATLVLYTRLD
jgi:membrane-bound inhibitor of C-type lysozyme